MDVAHPPKNLQSDQREPARRPARAVSAAEMPHNIFHYVLETSGWHQLWLVVLTVAVFLLEIVPLELQRRIVNDLTKHRNFSLIIVLCAVYAGTVLLQGGVKLVLNIYRSWVGERAIRELPLNGRNYTDLALLQPGVIGYSHRDGGSVVAHGLGISIDVPPHSQVERERRKGRARRGTDYVGWKLKAQGLPCRARHLHEVSDCGRPMR